MSAGRVARLVAAIVLGAVATTALGYGIAAGDDDRGPRPILGPERVDVIVTIDNSRFSPDHLDVVEGTEVRFVVVNDDPIDHELIVGPAAVHERHERGTHAVHGPVPGEVSVPALGVAATTYRFEEPGPVLVACHLPRHLAYGMVGEVVVHPA